MIGIIPDHYTNSPAGSPSPGFFSIKVRVKLDHRNWPISEVKTNFGPGVIVTSKWLNGAREIHFDGKDLDWHYDPINRRDIQRGGVDGIDNVYVTTNTDQVYGGVPITGTKSFMGLVQFGDKAGGSGLAAPKSWSTNAKFNNGGTNQNFNIKYAQLKNEDIITKEILSESIINFPSVDEGFF